MSQGAGREKPTRVSKARSEKEFEIPLDRHSWSMRITLALVVIVIVFVLGVGLYLYLRPDVITISSGAGNDEGGLTTSEDARSVDVVTENDIDVVAADLIDEIDTALDVNADFEPVGVTTTFAPVTEKIYVAIQTENLTVETQLSAEWFYVDEDTFIDEVVYGAQKGINNVAFNLDRPPSGFWPSGNYQIKIYVDGELAEIARFVVEASEDEGVESDASETTESIKDELDTLSTEDAADSEASEPATPQ